MREFGIRFSRGLRKGLRAYATSTPGNEMLVECHNLQPGENGLVSRDELMLADSTFTFTYFCLRSEAGDTWCVHIDTAGQIVTTPGPPSDIDGFTATNISLVPLPNYIEMPAINEPTLPLYIYPDIAGNLTVDYAPPVTGVGEVVNNLLFGSANGYRYNVAPTNTLETVVRPLI